MNDKIKQHFEDHKLAYICAGTLLAGVVIGKMVFGKPQVITNTAIASPVVNASANVTNGGYMRKIVECVETGELWRTVKEAAEAMGVDPTMMSKHLNGHTDNISNLHFKIVGLGTSS